MEDITQYPAKPSVEDFDGNRLRVEDLYGRLVFNGNMGGSVKAVRELNHPPVFYFHIDGMDMGVRLGALSVSAAKFITECEWKGIATYIDYATEKGWTASDVVWMYPAPRAGYEELEMRLAFSPNFFVCKLDDIQVEAEDPKGFYGGWVWPTPDDDPMLSKLGTDFASQD